MPRFHEQALQAVIYHAFFIVGPCKVLLPFFFLQASNYRRLQLACIGFHHEPGGVHLYHYSCICHGLLNRQEITRESEQKFGETGQSCVTPVPSKPRLLAGGAIRFSAMSEIRNVPPHGQDSVRKRLAHNIFKER